MSLVDIKNQIKVNLDALVTDTVLSGATITDIKKDPLSADIPNFPHAYLMPPSTESEVLDNRTIVRSYTFDIMILFQAEDIVTTTELEGDIEAILSKFDNDPTLGGTSMAGVLPVSSSPAPFQHAGKDLIMVIIQLTAKQYQSLTFA